MTEVKGSNMWSDEEELVAFIDDSDSAVFGDSGISRGGE